MNELYITTEGNAAQTADVLASREATSAFHHRTTLLSNHGHLELCIII